MMPSSSSESERLLDNAIELLLTPTLENLRSVEDLLRQAVVEMPPQAESGEGMARKVRLCGRLLEGAEATRPGSGDLGYDARGDRSRKSSPRMVIEL